MSDTEFGRDWDIARHIEFALSPHAVHNNAWNESAETVRAHITTQAAALEDEKNLSERLKGEAKLWAQEARTQRATVNECYQVATGATGEPGDWHGAEPIRALTAALTAAEERARVAEAMYEWWRRRACQRCYSGDCEQCYTAAREAVKEADE